MQIHELQAALTALIRDDPQWSPAQVGPLRFVASGWESEIYAFSLSGLATAEPVEMVLRLYPGDRAAEVARREYEALLQLHAAGYPVPQPYRLAMDSPYFEHPLLLMEFIAGEQMWSLFGSRSAPEVRRLLERLAQRLVELHQLDWRLFSEPSAEPRPTGPYFWIERWLAEVEVIADQLDLSPFRPVLDWLHEQQRRAACQQPAAVHWDFHPGNLIVQPDGGVVVLDWTQFSVSDPRFDLAWCLLLLRIYDDEAASQHVLSSYQRVLGAPVVDLDYFSAAMAFRRLGSIYISLTQGPERIGMRAGASQAMRGQRREALIVYDLLQTYSGVRLPQLESFFREAFS